MNEPGNRLRRLWRQTVSGAWRSTRVDEIRLQDRNEHVGWRQRIATTSKFDVYWKGATPRALRPSTPEHPCKPSSRLDFRSDERFIARFMPGSYYPNGSFGARAETYAPARCRTASAMPVSWCPATR